MAFYPDEEDFWKCPKHPSKRRRTGICHVCLRDRLINLCPNCANVRPCSCFVSSSSSSFSRAESGQTVLSNLIQNESANFHRSRSVGNHLRLPKSRNLSFLSVFRINKEKTRQIEVVGSDQNYCGPIDTMMMMTRSRSVYIPTSTVTNNSSKSSSERSKGWYFPSPMKVFRQSKTSKVVQERSPLHIVLCDYEYVDFRSKLLCGAYLKAGKRGKIPVIYNICLSYERFRKVDPDRWEFANEGFLRGQKHLLKDINRRKAANVVHHHQPQQAHRQTPPVGSCVEMGKFGLDEEIDYLIRDKSILTQELVRLRQQQQSTDSEMQTMVQRLQGMEQRQQQMMSFLAKAVNSPCFLAQFVQQQSDNNSNNNNVIAAASKKRRLKQDDDGVLEDGHMIRYQQPLMNDAAAAAAAAEEEALFRQIMKHENIASSSSSSSRTVDYGGSRLSQHLLHEVFPSEIISEVQSSSLGSNSQPILFSSSAAGGGEGLGWGSVCFPDNEICISSEVPVEMIGNICHEGEIEWENPFQELPSIGDPFWEELIASGPIIPPVDTYSTGEGCLADPLGLNRNSNGQKMEQLTEQMGLLSSNTIIGNMRDFEDGTTYRANGSS